MTTSSYEIQYKDGSIARVATLDDLIKLRRADLDNDTARLDRAPAQPVAVTPVKTGWAGFVEYFSDPEYIEDLKFISMIASHPKGIEITEIARVLETSDGGVGARRAQIGRMCTATGLDKNNILSRRGSSYFPEELLLHNDLPEVPLQGRKK